MLRQSARRFLYGLLAVLAAFLLFSSDEDKKIAAIVFFVWVPFIGLFLYQDWRARRNHRRNVSRHP